MAEENDNTELPEEEQAEDTRDNRVSVTDKRSFVDRMISEEISTEAVAAATGSRETTVQGWKENLMPRTYRYVCQLKSEIERLEFELLDALREIRRYQRG